MFNPSMKFGVAFVSNWNASAFVFLLVGNETTIHLHPSVLISICIPISSN